jgi:hypothetical protein
MRATILIAASALLVSSAFAIAAGMKRSKIECAKVSITKLSPGWGAIPAALQKLPPGAALCGVNAAQVAFITSELDAPALQKFYEPLFASVGCKPLTCKPDMFKRTECSCAKGADTRAGTILPQPYDQAYQLFLSM